MPIQEIKLETELNYGPLVLQQNGVPLQARQIINFLGSGITVTDNPTYYRSDISVYYSPLTNWFQGGISGKTVVMLGDSTTWQLDSITSTIAVTISGGIITAATVTNPTGGPNGANWTGLTPVLFVTDPNGGSGAVLTPVVTAGSLSVTVTFGGSGYSAATIVSFSSFAFTQYQQPNQPLNGVTIINFGDAGASCQAFNTDGTIHGISQAIAAKANLYIFDYGINDIRLGATSQSSLLGYIQTAITALKNGVPNASILLRMPAPFLTTDVGGHGYVSPNSSAQAYSTSLQTIYRQIQAQWPDIYLYDACNLVYGNTSMASSYLMTDQIHPTQAAYAFDEQFIAAAIGSAVPFSPGLAYNANQTSLTTPWTTYNRATEDITHYDLVTFGFVNGTDNSSYLRINGGSGAYYTTTFNLGCIVQGDIIEPAGQTPFIATTGSTYQNPGVLQLSQALSGTSMYTGQPIAIYRNRYFGDATIATNYLNTASWPVKARVLCYSSGTNFIRLTGLTPADNVTLHQISTTDQIVMAGYGSAISMSGASFGLNNGNIQINLTGSFGSLSGTYGYVFLSSTRLGQIWGTQTNDSALPGNVGEVQTYTLASGSAVALTSGTTANVKTSNGLTGGDYLVSGNINLIGTAATQTASIGCVTASSLAMASDGSEVYNGIQTSALNYTTSITIPPTRISVPSSGGFAYLTVNVTFSAGTVSAFGKLIIVRIR